MELHELLPPDWSTRVEAERDAWIHARSDAELDMLDAAMGPQPNATWVLPCELSIQIGMERGLRRPFMM